MLRKVIADRTQKSLDDFQKSAPKVQPQKDAKKIPHNNVERPETHWGTCDRCDEHRMLLNDNKCIYQARCDHELRRKNA